MSTIELTNKLQEAEQEWEERTLNPTLAKIPESRTTFTTTSLVPVERLYTPNSIPDFDYEADLGFPGQPPYTRGIHATGYRGKMWTMRQFAGYGSAFDTNRRFKYLLANGQTGHVARNEKGRDGIGAGFVEFGAGHHREETSTLGIRDVALGSSDKVVVAIPDGTPCFASSAR